MAKPTFDQFRKKALKKPQVKAEYDALEPIYAMKRQMIALQKPQASSKSRTAVKLKTAKSNI